MDNPKPIWSNRVGGFNGILGFELLLQYHTLKPLNFASHAYGWSWATAVGLLCKHTGLPDSIAAESAP